MQKARANKTSFNIMIIHFYNRRKLDIIWYDTWIFLSHTEKQFNACKNKKRNLYGDYAGWAHSVLFSADLRHLQDLKTQNGNENEKDTKAKIKKEPKKKSNSKDNIKTEVKEETDIKQENDIKEEPENDIPEKAAKKRTKASRAVIDHDNGKVKKAKN